MTTSPSSPGTEIAGKNQLVEYVEAGSKPPHAWRIGTEHEKFAFRLTDHSPLPYEGENGIGVLLDGLQAFGWKPVREGDIVVALSQDGASITLEPGGQFELSGAPLETVHQTCNEVNAHLAQVRQVTADMGVGMLGLGFHPTARRGDMPWMPKGRYKIMGEYMPKRGGLGLDMMLRSCTVQVNLDFASEADMVTKLRVGLALQPVATALFANSPFTEGKPNGFLSFRSQIWTDTDPDRTGMLPFAFEDGMGFERYVDYALDVPMYFVYRNGSYIDASGQSFRDFMDGRLPALPGERPRMGDFIDHLTTLFPEVRLKQFLEMRGADGGPWGRLCALPAFWVGLLYDDVALDAAAQLIKDISVADMAALRAAVPRTALKTPFRGATLRELAVEAVAISREGLRRRARRGKCDADETGFLDELLAIAASGRTPAEELLEAYDGRWAGRVEPLFKEYAY